MVHPENVASNGDATMKKSISPIPLAPDLAGALQWSVLKQAVFKLCNLRRIDESMVSV